MFVNENATTTSCSIGFVCNIKEQHLKRWFNSPARFRLLSPAASGEKCTKREYFFAFCERPHRRPLLARVSIAYDVQFWNTVRCAI
jgi:hypothetical protein